MNLSTTNITLPLQELLNELLDGSRDSRPISLTLATLIYGHLQNKEHYYIDFEGRDDPRVDNPQTWKLERPVLWKIDAWRIASANWKAARINSANRREQEWIRDENIVRLKKHIIVHLYMTEQEAQQAAYKLIHRSKLQQIKALGFDNWATSMEDVK